MNSFYSREELQKIGFAFVGENVLVSRKASIYSPEKISIGSRVRIDDFCILSGKITLGNNIHIAAYSALYGGEAGIVLQDYANISSRVCIYAVSDDYSGCTMTNPTVPDKYKHIQNAQVMIEKHVIIGSGSTVLPGVTLSEGSAIGAMSLCKEMTEPWKIYAGIPVKAMKDRSRKLLELEKDYQREMMQENSRADGHR